VAAISQATVRQSGVVLRLEAVRSDPNQKQYVPLSTFRDASSIERRCTALQQVVLFFVRTQREHTWRTPAYRFNPRQAARFEKMLEAIAEDDNTDEDDNADEDDREASDNGSDGADGHEAVDPYSGEPRRLILLQRAYLGFCMEFMTQTVHNKEYDIAMVCAMAVLGVHPGKGFRDPESYPQILSTIVKVGRFIMVQ